MSRTWYQTPATCSTCGAKAVTRTTTGPSCYECLPGTKITRLQERIVELEGTVAELRQIAGQEQEGITVTLGYERLCATLAASHRRGIREDRRGCPSGGGWL